MELGRFIVSAAHTYQSDVETVHHLIEHEFFDLETFTGRADFLAKATLYQLCFNLVRPNSHKETRVRGKSSSGSLSARTLPTHTNLF